MGGEKGEGGDGGGRGTGEGRGGGRGLEEKVGGGRTNSYCRCDRWEDGGDSCHVRLGICEGRRGGESGMFLRDLKGVVHSGIFRFYVAFKVRAPDLLIESLAGKRSFGF